MRKTIIIISLIGSFLILATVINLFDSFIMFLLFGVVPGSNLPLSANAMLIVYAVFICLAILYAGRVRINALRHLFFRSLRRLSHRSAA